MSEARKVIQLPGIAQTVEMTLAEAMGLAHEGLMSDVVVIHTTPDGRIIASWSKQGTADLAAAALVLTKIATDRLTD